MGGARGAPRVGVVVAGLVGFALAQGRTCNGPVDITDEVTLETLQACDIVGGHVTIHELPQSVLSALSPPGTIDLGELRMVEGDLRIMDISSSDPEGAGLSIEAPNLSTVEGALNLSRLERLDSVNLPSLTSAVDIAFADVGFAELMDFGKFTVQSLSSVQSITFTNTSIATIGKEWTTPFQPRSPESDVSLTIVDNSNLTNITIPGWRDANVHVRIERNGAEPAVDIPAMNTCTLTLSSVSSFTAGNIRQIGINEDSSTNETAQTEPKTQRRQTTESAELGGSSITGNSFEDLSLPNLLTIVAPLNISDNTALRTIHFSQLANVYSQVDISGDNISTFDTRPMMNLQAPLRIESANPQLCSSIQHQEDDFECVAISQSQGSGTSPQQTGGEGDDDTPDDQDPDDAEASNGGGSGGGGGGGLSTGAKAGIGVGVGLAVPLLLLLAFLLFRRRSRRSRPRTFSSMAGDEYTKDVSPSEAATSPARYSKVPSEMRTEEVGAGRPGSGMEHHRGHGRVSEDTGYGGGGAIGHAHARSDAMELEEQQGERFEMEEQQGMRHEMDARSLPDIDLDDEGDERRSLEDIERVRNSGPPVGPYHGPVSPVG